jgi:phosphoribosylamine--glycine ligase
MALRVMIVGSGGREHALAWKLAQSPQVASLVIAPGNPGTAALGERIPVPVTDIDGLVRVAVERAIDLVVVGPEDPLARGLGDRLRAAGVAVFGHSAAATRIESSKAYAKEVMAAAGAPTARALVTGDYDEAMAALDGFGLPVVIKADGLAAGKGVVVATTRAEADAALRDFLLDHRFGEASATVVLEEFLAGREVSVLALVDGETVVPLVPACDHKPVGDGNTGPNTGGMGAYAPAPQIDARAMAEIDATILRPVAREMVRRGEPLRGVLYAGLMLTAAGPKVLEFNARFGDPETQVILPILASDLLPLLLATARGELATAAAPQWSARSAVCVVLVAGGYPGAYGTGDTITGVDDHADRDDTVVFHAGTARNADGRLVTQGGRVLNVVGLGESLEGARTAAYARLAGISFPRATYRTDIGRFGLTSASSR